MNFNNLIRGFNTFFFASALMAVFSFSSCSEYESGAAQDDKLVNISLTNSLWNLMHDSGNFAESRAASRAEALQYPVNIMVAKRGDNEFAKVVTYTEGSQFSLALYPDDYDIFAVCGMSGGLPSLVADAFAVPDAADGQKKDVSIGKASITVSEDLTANSPVSMTVNHRLAKLTASIVDVAPNVASLKLYVKGLSEKLRLESDPYISTGAENKLTEIKVAKTSTVAGLSTYAGEQIVMPCSKVNGVDYIVDVVYTDNKHGYFSATSPSRLSSGTHLTQELSYPDLMPIDGSIVQGDWVPASNSSSLTGMQLNVGDQYLDYPATVCDVRDDQIRIIAHRPMKLSLSEFAAMQTVFPEINYTNAPEITGCRWIMPTGKSVSKSLYGVIDAMNAQMASTGGTVIDKSATNVIAFCASTTFYTYDLSVNDSYTKVADGTAGDFLYYPIGIIYLK